MMAYDDPTLKTSWTKNKKTSAGFPTNQAATERRFGHHKAIHSEFQAKLQDYIVEKMLFMRRNRLYNSVDETDNPEYDNNNIDSLILKLTKCLNFAH